MKELILENVLNDLKKQLANPNNKGKDVYQILATKYSITRRQVKTLAFGYLYGANI